MKDERSNPDVLTPATLTAALGKAEPMPRLFVHEVLDSTNAEAKRLLLSGETHPMLVVAERQTAGRGRMGREFYSPAQTGAYFSVAYVTDAPLSNAVTLTSAAAVAVMRAVRSLCGIQTSIKWVNDLYLDGRKICGILAESLIGMNGDGRGRLIIGIGVNLRTRAFPTALSGKAGSLGDENITRAALIAEVWRELSPFLRDPDDCSWLDDYRRHSAVLGKRIRWEQASHAETGIAVGIDADGALEVEREGDELVRLATGEISVFCEEEWR